MKPKYPGIPTVMDGNTAVVMVEKHASDAAGAYPITPSTQMGEGWAAASDDGHINISGRPLLFIEPEGEHAAAAVTAGFSMTGLRAANFSSGQGIAYMHESLYAAAGKRLTYVLNMGCRAMTKASLNVHAGHDDYHLTGDTGFFQLFAKNVQHVADLNLIAHRIAELALTPGIIAQDGFLTTHLLESLVLPERELIAEYLGLPEDIIECPTPAQRMLYGPTRRRIPELWTVDNPALSGSVQNQDAYMQSVAAQRPFFFDHIRELTRVAMDEYAALTGRRYNMIETWRCEDADYLLMGQGSVIPSAEAVADYMRRKYKIKVGVVNLIMYRPFPGAELSELLAGRAYKGLTVLERTDQPLAEDQPLMREIRSVLDKCRENNQAGYNGIGDQRPADRKHPFPGYGRMAADKAPALYSAVFGMGSRDLQPEGLIAAVENMLPEGAGRRDYYLSVDFVRKNARSTKEEIHLGELRQAYPHLEGLALRGSENPNLMPDGSITVRIHSIGGWGAVATGKNLTMNLADILGFYVKSNPKYGSEKKGQPTTYYLAVAPEPVRVNCEFFYVDVVLSPDPNVFHHSNPLAGLKEGGTFIIQSDAQDPSRVWEDIPARYRKIIRDKKIKVHYIDAFKIAREVATDPDLQFRMQGMAFQGAFFAVTNLGKGSDGKVPAPEAIFDRIAHHLRRKFGEKGERVVSENLKIVQTGYQQTVALEIPPVIEEKEKALVGSNNQNGQLPALPRQLKQARPGRAPLTDLHRFWEQTGSFYFSGQGNDNLADPFMALSLIPAASGHFRDMSTIRGNHPVWKAENCTACGKCFTVCPDTALPPLVNSFEQAFQAALDQMKSRGLATEGLGRRLRSLESDLRGRIAGGDSGSQSLNDHIADILKEHQSVVSTLPESLLHNGSTAMGAATNGNGPADTTNLSEDQLFVLFLNTLGKQSWSVTQPYYHRLEKQQPGSGGLLSITVDSTNCKGCMECIQVCDDNALEAVIQTDESVARLEEAMDLFHRQPATDPRFIRVDSLREGIGALETILLNKDVYYSMTGGDGACLGCSEKSVLHLFTATVTALMQEKVRRHLEEITELIDQLGSKLQETLSVHMGSPALEKGLETVADHDFSLAELSTALERQGADVRIDHERVRRIVALQKDLRELRQRYTDGVTPGGRTALGFVNSTGCSSVYGSTYPINPYPFPWTNHLFQDSPSMAMGIFEGHMVKMAEGFVRVRLARDFLAGKNTTRKDYQLFNWQDFTEEEFELCPPVVSVGGDGAMYDIGFQNLSRLLISGKPVKVVVLDTQVYSNTGGQACTSGFPGQISDMATFGRVRQGKAEIRKELGYIAMAHRSAFVLQSSLSTPGHMLEGFVAGLNSRRPALFNLFTSCQPEHGIGDDMGSHQARLAHYSRAWPHFRFDPDASEVLSEALDLESNPEEESDWVSWELKYRDERGREQTRQQKLTFADYAATENRFRKHFRTAPPETWDDDKMIPLADFLDLDAEERAEGSVYPFIWAVGKKGQLTRLLCSASMVDACLDRRQWWKILRELAASPDSDGNREQITEEVIRKVTGSLIELARGEA